jgi:hypothetical protein
MKHTTILISILAIAACGGGQKPEPAPPKEPEPAPKEPEPVAETKPPEPEPAPEPPPPPPPPKSFLAQAQVMPTKGSRFKGTVVTFTQEEGQPVAVGSVGWFDGIKAGKYHLVVHAGADCGANAAKAGKPIATADMSFTVAKGTSSLEVGQVATITLDGEGAIIGHALVLHDDKRGKPGKALGCGTIASSE